MRATRSFKRFSTSRCGTREASRLGATVNARERLARLFDLAPPPGHPVAVPGDDSDWEAVERALGTKLPEDYKAIIRRYGSGDFCDLLIVLNPFCSREDLNLLDQAGRGPGLYGPMLESYDRGRFGPFAENCPFPVYPDPGGLLPLATDSVGRDLFWLTRGEPSAWGIIRYNWRAGCVYENLGGSLAEFLVDWIAGELASGAARPGARGAAGFNPVFCPLGQVRDYGRSQSGSPQS
jgi:hypothetical protein